MTAEIKTVGSIFEVGKVKPLFKANPAIGGGGLAYLGGDGYDVSADGNRFLVNTFVEDESTSPLTLVVNWDAEVRNK